LKRRVLTYPSTDKSRKYWVAAYGLTGLVALLGCVLVMLAGIIGQAAVQDAVAGLRYAGDHAEEKSPKILSHVWLFSLAETPVDLF
jgi:hypothetical protein